LNFYFQWDRYDIHARCLRSFGEKGVYDYRFEWDNDNRINKSTDSRGATFTYHYNEQGQITKEIDPEGGSVVKAYDQDGNLTRLTDPNGNDSIRVFDTSGRLSTTDDPEWNRFSLDYDDQGHPIRLTDSQGQTWRQGYNAQGLVTQTTTPLGQTTYYNYNHQGLPTSIKDAGSHERYFQIDSCGNLISQTDANGAKTEYQHDALGNIIKVIGPDGNCYEYRYDALNNLTQAIQPDGSSVKLCYNALSLLTHFTDSAGRTTSYQYADGFRQVTHRYDPTGQVFTYQYDTERNLVGLVNEKGEQYSLKYDQNERLIEEIGFDGRTQRYEYDPAGYLTRHLEADKITSFLRDKNGRLKEKRCDGEQVAQYAYNAVGQLTEAKNAHRQVKFQYDGVGRLIQEQQDQAVIQHEYDVLGNRIQTVLPDHQTIDYNYDKEGLYQRVDFNGETLVNLERDILGRETKRQQGLLESQFDYDPMGRLQKHRVNNGHNPLIQRNYQYDEAGNLALIFDLQKGETHFKYDALDRLSQVTGLTPETFAFDPAGNLLSTNQTQAGYSEGHRLQMLGDRHFEYDVAGNLIRERRGKGGRLVTEYEYNTDNQLIQVIKEGQTFQYQYDALGRRISKQDAFGKTEFLWNGDVLLFETRNQIHKTYIYEPYSFRPLALIQDDEVYYYHLDHLGTPQEMTDAKGEIVWNVRYKAYGNVDRLEVERIENNLRFQGQYFDAETGLHYNRHRYYDPDAGRFIHQDPIGLGGGENLYLYVPNPIGWVDLLGLATVYLRNKEQYVGKAKVDAKTRYGKTDYATDIFTNIPDTDTAQGVEQIVYEKMTEMEKLDNVTNKNRPVNMDNNKKTYRRTLGEEWLKSTYGNDYADKIVGKINTHYKKAC